MQSFFVLLGAVLPSRTPVGAHKSSDSSSYHFRSLLHCSIYSGESGCARLVGTRFIFSVALFAHSSKNFKKIDVISRPQSESFRSSVFLSQNIKKLHIHDTNFIKLLDISFFCAIISLTTPLPVTAISDGTKHYEESGGYQYE